jgi:hypothetical protein
MVAVRLTFVIMYLSIPASSHFINFLSSRNPFASAPSPRIVIRFRTMKLITTCVVAMSAVCGQVYAQNPDLQRIVLANGVGYDGRLSSKIAWYNDKSPLSKPDDQLEVRSGDFYKWETQSWKCK